MNGAGDTRRHEHRSPGRGPAGRQQARPVRRRGGRSGGAVGRTRRSVLPTPADTSTDRRVGVGRRQHRGAPRSGFPGPASYAPVPARRSRRRQERSVLGRLGPPGDRCCRHPPTRAPIAGSGRAAAAPGRASQRLPRLGVVRTGPGPYVAPPAEAVRPGRLGAPGDRCCRHPPTRARITGSGAGPHGATAQRRSSPRRRAGRPAAGTPLSSRARSTNAARTGESGAASASVRPPASARSRPATSCGTSRTSCTPA